MSRRLVVSLVACAVAVAAGIAAFLVSLSPPAAPSARLIAGRMHCTVIGAGQRFDSPDVAQDVQVSGNRCPGWEVLTFASVAAEDRWLNAARQPDSVYTYVVAGSRWVVDPLSYDGADLVVKRIGGRLDNF